MSEGEEKEKRGKGKWGIDLSMAQVAGGGLATLSAATAASYLGVYGTIIGAAVMSVLSTAGTAVIQRFFQKSGDKAKVLAERAKRSPEEKRRWASSAAQELYRQGPGGTADAETLLAATTETHDGRESRSASGPEDTQANQAFRADSRHGGDEDETAVFRSGAGGPDSTEGAARTGVRGVDATRAMYTVGDSPFARGAGSGDSGEGPEEEGPWWKRRTWKLLLIPALIVFGLAMVVILVFELFTGRSLTDTVHGRDAQSAPTLMGGYSEDQQQPPGEEPGPDPEGQEYDSPGQEVPPRLEEPGGEPGYPDEAPETEGQPEEPTGEPGEQEEPGTGGQQDAPAEQDDGEGQGGGDTGNGGAAPPGGQYNEPQPPS